MIPTNKRMSKKRLLHLDFLKYRSMTQKRNESPLYPDSIHNPSLSSQCRHKNNKTKIFPSVRQLQRLSYCPAPDRQGQSWDCNPLTGAGSNPLGASRVEDLAILLTQTYIKLILMPFRHPEKNAPPNLSGWAG